MSLGVAIGAITFTGSVIAFLKLSGRMSGKPIMLPARHVINIALAIRARCAHRLVLRMQSISLLAHYVSFIPAWHADHHPIGGADMPVVISMLNSYSGWAAAGIGSRWAIPR